MSFLYFAYGSNMLPARLSSRCPSARVRSLAQARDFSVEFSKPSTDGSGKATIIRSRGSTVLGVIYEVDEQECEELDRYEGAGQGYKRIDEFGVETIRTGEQVNTTTYMATATDPRLQPFDWYLAVVIAGAIHHAMDQHYVAMLRANGAVIDPRPNRSTRLRALEAMRLHHISDYRALLE